MEGELDVISVQNPVHADIQDPQVHTGWGADVV